MKLRMFCILIMWFFILLQTFPVIDFAGPAGLVCLCAGLIFKPFCST